jgi:exodeoxyribonuclease V alpha subunit
VRPWRQTVNAIERLLAEASLIRPDVAFYVGRPILITRNDYQLQLFNGDVGRSPTIPLAQVRVRVLRPTVCAARRFVTPAAARDGSP